MITQLKRQNLNSKDNVQKIPSVSPSPLAEEDPDVLYSPVLGECSEEWSTEQNIAEIEEPVRNKGPQ